MGGPLLGVFDGVAFPGHRCRLQSGETIVAFSDGLSEAPGPGDDLFGDERLVAAARAHRSARPAALVEALFAAIRDFSGALPATDDATITVLQVSIVRVSGDRCIGS